MILDVGCGFLSQHQKRGGIGIDLIKGKCDIVADMQNLPFQNNVFSFVYARACLEHVDKPVQALKELKRILKRNGKISITIPIYHNLSNDELLKFVVGFPLRSFWTVRRLRRWRKLRSKPGFLHANKIEPKHIAAFFVVLKCKPLFGVYPLSRKPFKKLFKNMRYPFPDAYYLYCSRL